MQTTRYALLALSCLLAASACTTPQPNPTTAEIGKATVADWHSFANAQDVTVRHLKLDLDVDFDAKQLTGKAVLTFQRLRPETRQLILDTRDIDVIRIENDSGSVTWNWGESDSVRGRSLVVDIEDSSSPVTIHYRTSPKAAGLQWLNEKQTTSGLPFLFTQSQAIQARSWIPLQDTPQVRFTYEATIRTPPGLRAVMSAANPTGAAGGTYQFSMPQPIPSYLMALSAGRLNFSAMSKRTGVFAEPTMVEPAAAEFSDTEKMIEVGEALYGPYRWGRYDLLILPPSFPFGGMENPRLSFITPTVIAGDKSLVALIAHELAHSWSGNLVTNASWDDLWLNEGFTVYFESRIMELVYGKEREAMEAVLGYQSLMDDFADLPPEDQHLALDLAGRDPDDAFSQVPYEKGRFFLVWLEHRLGRADFDQFIRGYFDEFAFKSLSTEQFLSYLDTHLLVQDSVDVTMAEVRQWVYEPGLPTFAILPKSDAFTKVDTQRAAWLQGSRSAQQIDAETWSVHEWLYFLNNMPKLLEAAQLAALDEAFDLTASRNNEIAHSWLRLTIRNRYQAASSRLEQYLIAIGRRKLVLPLYEDLIETPEGTAFARRVFTLARPGYHPLTVSSVEKLFTAPLESD